MFVLCDECLNHYDDSSQSEECFGFDSWKSHRPMMPTPVELHVTDTRQAWVNANLGGIIPGAATALGGAHPIAPVSGTTPDVTGT